jgi:hypothetical protein
MVASGVEAGLGATPAERAGELQRKVVDVLSRGGFRRWRMAPELRKVLVSLPEALDELRRLLGRRAVLDQATTDRLTTLLDVEPARLDLDGAWQLLEGIQAMYLGLGADDPAYVRSLLEVEQGLEARPDDDWEEPWPYYGWGRVRWRQVFPKVPIDDLLARVDQAANETGPTKDPAGSAAAAAELLTSVERLQRLFRARVENGRKRRTRLALRSRFFLYSLLVLAPLVVGLAVGTHQVGDLSWSTVVSIAIAGAVGGTVSGTLKLRGMIRITQFRLLGAGLLVQPFISAAGALFVAFVLVGGVVSLAGVDGADTEWAVLAAYGFVAGFSEPFWLGVVSKIAGDATDG